MDGQSEAERGNYTNNDIYKTRDNEGLLFIWAYHLLQGLLEVVNDASQRVTLLDLHDLPEIGPAVRAAEGQLRGVAHHALQTRHADAVAALQLARLGKEVLAHRAREEHLERSPLSIVHLLSGFLRSGSQWRIGEGG